MADFIGRRTELAVLEEAYRSPSGALIPVYGRRRVGKSELLLRFLADRPGIYFLGKRAPAALQLREFLSESAAVLSEPLLASFATEDWQAALRAVVERWPQERPLVLAFDEFQWTAAASPELPSVLQGLWDRDWSRGRRVLLILCGSYIGFMEREILGKKSPLFGRRTAQIFLQPFGYREAALFHPGYSVDERARAYFVCGGIPLYLRAFAPGSSVETNIAHTLLDEYAPLHRESDFLLREELREVEKYYAILAAIAAGHRTQRAIAQETGLPNRNLSYYIQQLLELRYLRRRYPLTERRPSQRHVRFELDDPLLAFWFRFVFPHTSYIRQMGAERAFRDLIRPELDAWWGSRFELLCREALPLLYAREGVAASFEVGEFWSKETQIDVVGLRQDGWTDIGECKWGTALSARGLAAELEEKVRRYPNARNATIGRRLFTRRAPRGALPTEPSVRVHTLEDLYRG